MFVDLGIPKIANFGIELLRFNEFLLWSFISYLMY